MICFNITADSVNTTETFENLNIGSKISKEKIPYYTKTQLEACINTHTHTHTHTHTTHIKK